MISFQKILVTLLFCFSFSFFVIAQDKVIFLDGTEQECRIKAHNDTLTWIEKPVRKKIKEIYIDNDEIFSLNFADTFEVVIYKPDAAKERTFTIDQMRLYVSGASYAQKHFKTHFSTAGGFITGAGGPLFLGFYGIAVPVAYDLIAAAIQPFPKPKTDEDIALFQNQFFILGYQTIAQKKKIRNVILSSITGFVAVGTYSFINFMKN
ncbi:MAG: hypothetical protein PHT69_08685 [Bacteroidales bacterium]|nr:hypothetical protein [Bacteroidales bacterium]